MCDVSATGSGPSERAVPVDDAGASTPPRDVFSSAEFDAVDFLNRLFPDETSLTGVDALVAKLRLRVRRVDDEILEAVRSQSTGGVRAKADLAQAQTAILELGARIRDIKDKAELSETMVQEICRDIKKLDRAKRHLTGTITALRRLSMLVSAVDQLETMAMRRQYHDSANLLEAVNQLSAHFDGYNDVRRWRSSSASTEDPSRAPRQRLRGIPRHLAALRHRAGPRPAPRLATPAWW